MLASYIGSMPSLRTRTWLRICIRPIIGAPCALRPHRRALSLQKGHGCDTRSPIAAFNWTRVLWPPTDMSNTHLTRQIGEHLVVAELGRHGIVATPFAGNMPDYDVVALTPTGQSIYIQVKAMNSGDWQLNAKQFLLIEYDRELNQQRNNGLRLPSVAPLFFVLVKIIGSGKDEFYVLAYSEVQRIVLEHYTAPARESTHFALRRAFVLPYRVEALTHVHFASEAGALLSLKPGGSVSGPRVAAVDAS
jgi:hypothetical protein